MVNEYDSEMYKLFGQGSTDEHLNRGNLPAPHPPSNNKGWHSSVTADLRSDLVSKLVKAIFPDPAAIRDQRVKDLVAYSYKVEKEMFEYANDREDYYHLLAEKIYKIRQDLQDKENRRARGE